MPKDRTEPCIMSCLMSRIMPYPVGFDANSPEYQLRLSALAYENMICRLPYNAISIGRHGLESFRFTYISYHILLYIIDSEGS